MSKPATLPRVPPAPRADREPMSKMEQVYYALLRHWYAHRKVAPTMNELANVCRPRRSTTAIRSALLSLESKGYVLRNNEGRFEVVA